MHTLKEQVETYENEKPERDSGFGSGRSRNSDRSLDSCDFDHIKSPPGLEREEWRRIWEEEVEGLKKPPSEDDAERKCDRAVTATGPSPPGEERSIRACRILRYSAVGIIKK